MTKEYRQEVLWWDADDNEYLLEGTFNYYHPEPDVNYYGEGVLVELELLDQQKGSPDIENLLSKGGDIWNYVEDSFDVHIARAIEDYFEEDYPWV